MTCDAKGAGRFLFLVVQFMAEAHAIEMQVHTE